jgi:hypothetical protein
MIPASWRTWVHGAASCLDRNRLLDFFIVAGMSRRQFFHLQNVHTEVADFTQGQSGELWDCLADSPKNIIDGGEGVTTADCLKQITQNFPIIARVARRAHSAIQSLQSALAIDHRAALEWERADVLTFQRFTP